MVGRGTLNESASQRVGLDPMVSGLGEEGLDGGVGGGEGG